MIATTTSAAGRGRTVLVVDDDPDMLLLCRLQLSSHAFDVVTAETGAEAVTAIGEYEPDVVVMDYTLPDTDGPALVETIRRQFSTEMPVVMLTARTGVEDEAAAWVAGVFDYVVKPFDESRLTDAVEAALAPDHRDDAERRTIAALDRLRGGDGVG